MKLLKIGLILLALALFIFACNQTNNTSNPANNVVNNNTVANTNTQTSSPAISPPAVDEHVSAKNIYKEICSNCHKEDGTGGKTTIEGKTINAENFRTEKMKNMADEKYFKYIENGILDEGMPAFKGKLTDDQIKSVVKFIRKEFQGKS